MSLFQSTNSGVLHAALLGNNLGNKTGREFAEALNESMKSMDKVFAPHGLTYGDIKLFVKSQLKFQKMGIKIAFQAYRELFRPVNLASAVRHPKVFMNHFCESQIHASIKAMTSK